MLITCVACRLTLSLASSQVDPPCMGVLDHNSDLIADDGQKALIPYMMGLDIKWACPPHF